MGTLGQRSELFACYGDCHGCPDCKVTTAPRVSLAQATAAYEAALTAWRGDMSPENAMAANESHKVMRALNPVPQPCYGTNLHGMHHGVEETCTKYAPCPVIQ